MNAVFITGSIWAFTCLVIGFAWGRSVGERVGMVKGRIAARKMMEQVTR